MRRYYCLIEMVIGLMIKQVYAIMGKYQEKRRISMARKTTEVLLVAHRDKMIQSSLTNAKKTLREYFNKTGFTIHFVSDTDDLKIMQSFVQPVVVGIDCTIDKELITQANRLVFKGKFRSSVSVVFYYNMVTHFSDIRNASYVKTFYFGNIITDQDIWSIISVAAPHRGSFTRFLHISPDAALEGVIENESLYEVFQFLEISRKCGYLFIEQETPKGLIYFHNGVIIYASTQNSKGEDAVNELLNVTDGYFKFIAGSMVQNSNCTLSTTRVLIERMKVLDERKMTISRVNGSATVCN